MDKKLGFYRVKANVKVVKITGCKEETIYTKDFGHTFCARGEYNAVAKMTMWVAGYVKGQKEGWVIGDFDITDVTLEGYIRQ